MLRKRYRVLSSLIDARDRCEKLGNIEWFEKHNEKINDILDSIPHGSGINFDWFFDLEPEKFIFWNKFDCMDENGCYDIVIPFKVIVKPSLQFGIDINIKGNFSAKNGKYSDIADYIYQVFDFWLKEEIEY